MEWKTPMVNRKNIQKEIWHAYNAQMLNIRVRDGISREIEEDGGVCCEGKEKQKDEDSENSDAKQRV